MTRAIYRPEIFAVSDLDEAKRIILTPTSDASTEERWAKETPYLADLAARELGLSSDSLVIDYGCGIGRLSGAMIDKVGCRVLGVDISHQMRALATSEQPSPNFCALSRGMLERLVSSGFRTNAAIAVWVLQHIPNVEDDIALLRTALPPDGRLLVVNIDRRAIPTDRGWVDDGKDIRSLLDASFDLCAAGELDPAMVGPGTSAHAFWAMWQRPTASIAS